MNSCKFIIILQSDIIIRIHVSKLYQNCGLVTCKNEKYFYDYYNEFEYNHDLVCHRFQ